MVNCGWYKSRCCHYMVVASDWCMGGWKQRTCSTGILSESLVFKYLFKTAKIWLFRIWNFLIRSTIFFNCWKEKNTRDLLHIHTIRNPISYLQFDANANTCRLTMIADLQCLWHFRPSYPPCWPWERGNRNPTPQTSVAVTTGQWERNLPSSVLPHTALWKEEKIQK